MPFPCKYQPSFGKIWADKEGKEKLQIKTVAWEQDRCTLILIALLSCSVEISFFFIYAYKHTHVNTPSELNSSQVQTLNYAHQTSMCVLQHCWVHKVLKVYCTLYYWSFLEEHLFGKPDVRQDHLLKLRHMVGCWIIVVHVSSFLTQLWSCTIFVFANDNVIYYRFLL